MWKQSTPTWVQSASSETPPAKVRQEPGENESQGYAHYTQLQHQATPANLNLKLLRHHLLTGCRLLRQHLPAGCSCLRQLHNLELFSYIHVKYMN